LNEIRAYYNGVVVALMIMEMIYLFPYKYGCISFLKDLNGSHDKNGYNVLIKKRGLDI